MKKTLALLMLLAGLSVEAQGIILYWTGAKDEYWNDLQENWKDKDGKVVAFLDGDDVVFDNNCQRSYIMVQEVSPGSMLVDNSAGNPYTFGTYSSGRIYGNMNLTKRGEGDLIIRCDCTYEGDTFIYGGTTCIDDKFRPSKFGDEELVWLGDGDIFLYGGRLRLSSMNANVRFVNDIYVRGEASLDCKNLVGSLTVQNTGKLTLDNALHGRGGNLILQDGAMVNVGGYSVKYYGGTGTEGLIKVDGNATLGNGEICKCILNVAAGKTLALLANTFATSGTNFNLGEGATLDLGGNSVNFVDTTVSSSGDGGYLGHGTITGDLSLKASSRINLLENTTITGGVNLGDNASLDLGKNAISASVTLSGGFATIGNGTINGNLTVAENKSLALLANTTVTGAISLGQNSTLNLGGNTVSCDVSLGLDSVIGNGSVNGAVTFAEGDQQVALCGDLGGTGDISIGVVNQKYPSYTFYTSSLDLGGHTLTKGLNLIGDTTVSNGRLVLDHDIMMTFLEPSRTVTIGKDTTVDLNGHTFMHDLVLKADTAIGNGTIGGKVTVNEGKSVHLFGETKIDSNCEVVDSYAFNGCIEVGDMTIQALHRPIIQPLKGTQGEQAVSVSPQPIIGPVYPGLMKELTVSENEIIGTGRASSLADGLEIQSESDLMIQGMTITADNKISVGEHTITLKDVTIKLSQTTYKLVEGIYYFNLSDLFHCSVDMADVTFDASDLTLPEGFNPETDSISFNLGDATLTAETAERDIYLLLGGYGSRTMSIDEQGRPVFTKLVETPEPTTGTLSLMALAGLCARRRRK